MTDPNIDPHAPVDEPTPGAPVPAAGIPEPLPAPVPFPGNITDQKEVVPGNVGVPTQVANPRRASWRTVIQSIVGVLIIAVPLVNATLAQISEYLRQQTDVAVPGWVWVVLNAGLAVTALVAGLVSRVMNTPGVAAFIEKYLPFLAPIKQYSTPGEHVAGGD